MTEKETNLLAVFEDRIHELMKICDGRKRRIGELETLCGDKDLQIREAKQTIASLQSKYANMLAARSLAENKDGFGDVRKRVDKLVREVETCIELLKE
ncbi:MAG: hypothetical protein LBT42_09265 [Tannerella sp.]|jgi:hypothetical protein|nr:hypothetical protein [Tannerella sp.]